MIDDAPNQGPTELFIHVLTINSGLESLLGDAIATGDGVPLSRVLLATTSLQQGKGREINK